MTTMTAKPELQLYVSPPALEAISRDGIAVLPPEFSQHLDGFAELIELGREFAASERVALARADFESGNHRPGYKQFLVKSQDDESWSAEDALVRFATHPLILDTAIAALHGRVLLQSANLWCVLPSVGKPKEWSQSWHRDPEAPQLIKGMLYLDDVTEDCGPFQYIVGSHRGDWDVCEARSYVKPEDVARLPMDRCRTVCGPRGTLVLVNTAGMHRGGYGTKRRLTANWTFVPTCGIPFRVTSVPAEATPQQLIALGLEHLLNGDTGNE